MVLLQAANGFLAAAECQAAVIAWKACARRWMLSQVAGEMAHDHRRFKLHGVLFRRWREACQLEGQLRHRLMPGRPSHLVLSSALEQLLRHAQARLDERDAVLHCASVQCETSFRRWLYRALAHRGFRLIAQDVVW